MTLNYKHWNAHEAEILMSLLRSHAKPDKEAWGRRILNTQLKLYVVATPIMKELSQKISQGNYQGFLAYDFEDSYEIRALKGMVVSHIRDDQIKLEALRNYVPLIECWALCDLLSFKINASNHNLYREVAEEFISSPEAMTRRVGLLIRFVMLEDPSSLVETLDLIESLYQENAYYVHMMAAWVVSEALIRYPTESEAYLDQHSLNPNIINKAIQKCRDSNRLDQVRKDALRRYKKSKKA